MDFPGKFMDFHGFSQKFSQTSLMFDTAYRGTRYLYWVSISLHQKRYRQMQLWPTWRDAEIETTRNFNVISFFYLKKHIYFHFFFKYQHSELFFVSFILFYFRWLKIQSSKIPHLSVKKQCPYVCSCLNFLNITISVTHLASIFC